LAGSRRPGGQRGHRGQRTLFLAAAVEPFRQRHHHRRLAVVAKPAIDDKTAGWPGGLPVRRRRCRRLLDLRREVHGEQIAHALHRLEDLMEAQPATLEQRSRRVVVVEWSMQSIRPSTPSSATLPPRSAAIGVCSPAQASSQPIASDNRSRSSAASAGCASKALHLRELPVSVAHLRLGQATVVVADPQRLVGRCRPAAQRQTREKAISQRMGVWLSSSSGIAPAGQPVLDAAQDQRTAVLRLARPDFVERQPVGRQDAVVELPRGIVADDLAGEGKAQIGQIAGARCG
jgi:hypothetical protein